MIRRLPVVATLVVLLAVATMVRLGLWQLERRDEKAALIATYQANLSRPAIALPAFGVSDTMLYRRVSAFCLQPVAWRTGAGEAIDGRPGWRHIASCRTGAEGPGFAVDVGTSPRPEAPAWSGGQVTGRLTHAPDGSSIFARMLGRIPPPEPMIVADAPAPGLRASAQPDPRAVPNNHLSYAVQWFLFAGAALVIYALALRRRLARA